MSRKLPEDPSDWSDDDKAYAKDREWLVPEGVDLSTDSDVSPESIRKMTKAKLVKFIEEDETGLLAGVDTSKNKDDLAEDVVAAMFEEV